MKIKIKPKDGLSIPMPENGRMLMADGQEVEQSSYWVRRIEEGDVILMSEEKMDEKKDKKQGAK